VEEGVWEEHGGGYWMRSTFWNQFGVGPGEAPLETLDMTCPACQRLVRFICPPKLSSGEGLVEHYKRVMQGAVLRAGVLEEENKELRQLLLNLTEITKALPTVSPQSFEGL
jgi:hypothetical protein